MNQPLNTLAEIFDVILQEYRTEKELSQFYRDYYAKNVDYINKVSSITQTTFSLLDDMRNYYYKLFERAGFNKSEAINKILTPFAAVKAAVT